MQEVRGQQREMDKFTDEAQTLQQLTSESRVGNFVSQITARYQALLSSGKVSFMPFINQINKIKQENTMPDHLGQWCDLK